MSSAGKFSEREQGHGVFAFSTRNQKLRRDVVYPRGPQQAFRASFTTPPKRKAEDKEWRQRGRRERGREQDLISASRALEREGERAWREKLSAADSLPRPRQKQSRSLL
eukprot:2324591-Rhodomonas_salina.1